MKTLFFIFFQAATIDEIQKDSRFKKKLKFASKNPRRQNPWTENKNLC